MGQGALNRANAEEMVLLSIHAAGADGRLASELRRELFGLVSHHLTPGEWRSSLDDILTDLLDRSEIEIVSGKRLGLTRKGEQRAAQSCGGRLPKGVSWPELRNRVLVAKALVEVSPDPGSRKSLARRAVKTAGDLRAAILENAFKLKLKPRRTAAEIRRQLAGKATKGGDPHSGGTTGNRQAAARLLQSKRAVDTDDALIRQLAAEQVGSLQTDVMALRTALLRRLIVNDRPAKTARSGRKPADAKPTQGELPLAPAAAVAMPPALQEFARATVEAARQKAEGWAGNRRAFVSKVWSDLAETHPHWGLDEAGFKSLLVDAHREGLISLTNADVRDRAALPDLEASAVQHSNSVWHYIRVEN